MDTTYWNNFYDQPLSHLSEPSSFATFIYNKLLHEDDFVHVVDLGAGTGRDAHFFQKYGHVTAIEMSEKAIEKINSKCISKNITTIHTDFTTYDYSQVSDIDIFYSRFTLHAISDQQERVLLENIYNNLKPGKYAAIECRTTKDSLYKIGDRVTDNTYMTDHHRRFVDSQKFIKSVLDIKFKIVYFNESKGLSILDQDDPTLMRIILQK